MKSNELEAFLEYILVVKALSPKTIEAYTNDLTYIEQESSKPLIKLDTNEIFAILSKFNNNYTLNRKLSAINAFYDFCYKSHFMADTKKFKLSKLPASLPKYLKYEQIQEGLNLINKNSWIGYRDYALILFLYATGMRVSEAINVTYSDIEDEWVKVRFAKGEKERLVPIAPSALEALYQYRAKIDKESDTIWLNYQGKQLSRISVFKITKKYLNVSPHVLRHSYATALIIGGADLRVVQELLGHSSLLTTQIYTHIEKRSLRETVLAHHPLR